VRQSGNVVREVYGCHRDGAEVALDAVAAAEARTLPAAGYTERGGPILASRLRPKTLDHTQITAS